MGSAVVKTWLHKYGCQDRLLPTYAAQICIPIYNGGGQLATAYNGGGELETAYNGGGELETAYNGGGEVGNCL